MTVADLVVRGFVRYPTLPKAYSICQRCGNYQWFGWWQAPDRMQVAACEVCGTLAHLEAAFVTRYPVVALQGHCPDCGATYASEWPVTALCSACQALPDTGTCEPP
jgi:hypothetical protein